MFTRLRSLPEKTKARIQAASFLLPFGIVASLMIYGILRWPMSPIREVAGRYVDKAGTMYSEWVYQQFLVWQASLYTSFALFFVSILVVGWLIGLPFRPLPSVRNASRKKKGNAPET